MPAWKLNRVRNVADAPGEKWTTHLGIPRAEYDASIWNTFQWKQAVLLLRHEISANFVYYPALSSSSSLADARYLFCPLIKSLASFHARNHFNLLTNRNDLPWNEDKMKIKFEYSGS